ncbi:putative protein kinase-like domain superfamily [Helianthus annuus]|nr:putative protein kinase-like domain superfamily [Helianthus annuus]
MALYSSALIQSTSCYHNNLPTTLFKPSCLPRMATNHGSFRKQIKCSLSLEFEQEDASVSTSGFLRRRIQPCHQGDEAVFEAIIVNSDSPLNNTKVVLRRLTTSQAQRRGKRSKELARRKLMYHSYSMQVHGYVCPQTMDDEGSFTLVHGYHGSFSLRHWLRQADWLPTLEATLALDEESVRRVGDDTVNYLHSHGLAHTELRLENVHISPVDRHIKVGILGNAADFFEDDTDRQQMMIAFDMRCLGFIMVKMILRELMDPLIFTKFKAFLNKGNDPSCLREFLLRTFNMNSSHGNVGLQMLDRNWGAGLAPVIITCCN